MVSPTSFLHRSNLTKSNFPIRQIKQTQNLPHKQKSNRHNLTRFKRMSRLHRQLQRNKQIRNKKTLSNNPIKPTNLQKHLLNRNSASLSRKAPNRKKAFKTKYKAK